MNDILKERARNPNIEEAKIKAKELADTIERATGVRPAMGQAPVMPDYPPCDYCGEEFAGKMHCSRCSCVFYCSKVCQAAHWKAGHKKVCAAMKEDCQQAAETFIEIMGQETEDYMNMKVNPDIWNSMDNAGTYKMALAQGLNGTIQALLKDDLKNADDWNRSGKIGSFVQFINCQLFRNGRNIPGKLFSAIDAYRIKKYVRSSDEAFELWFSASMNVIQIFQTHGMAAGRMGRFGMGKFWSMQRMARDIAASWGYVFTSTKASKAILLGESKVADDAAVARAKWIIAQLKKIIPQFPLDSTDKSAAIEGEVNMFTAMIEVRLDEFGVNVGNFMSLLGLRGMKKHMYDDMALPFALGTIAKGKPLTTMETQKVRKSCANEAKRLQHRRNATFVSEGSSTSISASSSASVGKKKGKKKRKKNGKK